MMPSNPLKACLFLMIIFAGSIQAEQNPAPIVAGAKIITPAPNADPNDLGVLDAYSEAVKLEEEITRIYQEVRASRLSKIQRQSLEKSLEQVLVPISARLEPNKDIIDSTPNSSEELKVYQEELQRIMTENKAIVANAEEMLRSLLPEEPPTQQETQKETIQQILAEITSIDKEALKEKIQQTSQQSTDAIQQQIEQLDHKAQEQIEESKEALEDALKEMKKAETMVEKKLEELKQEEEEKKEEQAQKVAEKLVENLKEAQEAVKEAIEAITEDKEDVAQKVEDAREALKKIEEAIAHTTEADETLAAQKQPEPKQHTEAAIEKLDAAKSSLDSAMESMLLAAQMQDMLDAKLSGNIQIAQQQALGVLARAEAGQFLDISAQMRAENLNIKPVEVPVDKRPPPIQSISSKDSGRKFLREGGTSSVWFYVSDWYIIGPYDNKGRMNIQRVFPPESIIDLDANYLGKNSERISWFYDSFAVPMVNPTAFDNQYTIYYGYTEMYFEEAADLWIAVGSDDRSDLWINNLPVWHSSNELKGWRIDEGFRKVHFKKGLNKIVFRLENGWHAMGFSLLINATPNPGSSTH